MTISDYLTGARLVVGTLGACGLMLLACSWFVLGPGDLGKSRDVGVPAPVRIAHATSERTSIAEAVRTRVVSARRPTRRPATHAVAATRPHAKLSPLTLLPRTSHVPTAGNVESPPVMPPPPAALSPAAQAAAVTTPALPNELPQVSLPPVSVPAVPAVQLPAVIATTTTQLGLP